MHDFSLVGVTLARKPSAFILLWSSECMFTMHRHELLVSLLDMSNVLDHIVLVSKVPMMNNINR